MPNSFELDGRGASDRQLLATGVAADPCRVRPGDEVRVQPALYTGDGLLIVTCYRGSPTTPAGDSGTTAAIALRDTGGRPLATARSGFA